MTDHDEALSEQGLKITGQILGRIALGFSIILALLAIMFVVDARARAQTINGPGSFAVREVLTNWVVEGTSQKPLSNSVRAAPSDATDARAKMVATLRQVMTADGYSKAQIDAAVVDMGKALKLRKLDGEKQCSYEWRGSDGIVISAGVTRDKFPMVTW